MEKLNWSATQWPICFFRILRVVNWEQDEDIDVSKVVSSILNGKIPLSFDLSLVEVAVFKVFPILVQFLWFHCDDSARRKTNKRGWWIIKNFLFLYTTISIFEGKDGLEIYNFNRTDGLDRVFRRKKILLNVTHVYVSRCNNKSKEVENRNFFRADRSNYRVKFDGGSEQIATTDGIRMVLEREGDEGITGNRKQTFGFIERGIVEQKRYKYLIPVVRSAKQKQKSPCFLSILFSSSRPEFSCNSAASSNAVQFLFLAKMQTTNKTSFQILFKNSYEIYSFNWQANITKRFHLFLHAIIQSLLIIKYKILITCKYACSFTISPRRMKQRTRKKKERKISHKRP